MICTSWPNTSDAHRRSYTRFATSAVEPREAVAGEHRLRYCPAECDHREPPVLQLLETHLLCLLGVLRQEVQTELVVSSVFERETIGRRALGKGRERLDDTDPQEDLEQGTEVVLSNEDVMRLNNVLH